MAKKKKPKKSLIRIKDPKKHAQLRRRLRYSFLPTLNSQLSDLLEKRNIFWQLQDIAKENKEILKPGTFFDWMCSNYNYAITVGIRKFDDQDSRSRSLLNMLSLILKHPGVIKRSNHKAMYRKGYKALGGVTFDKLVGRGIKRLPQLLIRSDIRNLKIAIKRIRRVVNKDFAHFGIAGSIRKYLTYSEVEKALDTIEEILNKYNLLLTGINQEFDFKNDSWKQVLQKQWVKS